MRLALLTLAVATLAGCSLLRSAPPPVLLESVTLQADDPNPARTEMALEAGVEYTVVVSGTYSVWPASMWVSPCVGETEPKPAYGARTGGANQPVGLDPAYAFAGPRRTVICDRGVPSVRQGWVYRTSPEAEDWTLAETDDPYDPDHTYTYLVRGEGAPLEMLIRENDDFRDNYGRLRVALYGPGGEE